MQIIKVRHQNDWNEISVSDPDVLSFGLSPPSDIPSDGYLLARNEVYAPGSESRPLHVLNYNSQIRYLLNYYGNELLYLIFIILLARINASNRLYHRPIFHAPNV